MFVPQHVSDEMTILPIELIVNHRGGVLAGYPGLVRVNYRLFLRIETPVLQAEGHCSGQKKSVR
jgi:hypothetical protein